MNTTDMPTKRDFRRAQRILRKNPYVVYWDRGDRLTEGMIAHYANSPVKNPAAWLEDYFGENLLDTDTTDHVRETLSREGFRPDHIDRLINDGDVCGEVPLDFNLGHFLKEDVCVRFELLSNYDCFNSFHFETRGWKFLEAGENYLGDVFRVLHVDPRTFRETWKQAFDWEFKFDQEMAESIPAGEAWIDSRRFLEELENQCSPATLLTLPVRMPFRDLDRTVFTVAKGTKVGFYSSWQGGGSLFAGTTLRAVTIDLSRKEYPYWRMLPDCSDGYSMKTCYGVGDEFFSETGSVSTRESVSDTPYGLSEKNSIRADQRKARF